MSQGLFHVKSILVQVMAWSSWCIYRYQCWLSSMKHTICFHQEQSMLIHCGLLWCHIIWHHKTWVSNGSGNGMLPDSTKPLPEPLLTNHQWGHVAYTWGQCHRRCKIYLSLIWVWKWKWLILDYSHSHGLWQHGLHGHWCPKKAVKSSPPSAAYMRQWIRPSLVQIMGCRRVSTKPLSEPMQEYCQSDPWEQTSVKF